MLNYIIGEITDKSETTVTCEVNGIGFELFSSFTSISQFEKGEKTKVFTYLQANEAGMSLFGFSNKEERILFKKLILVSGIGPKSAIAILSSESMEKIVYYIASGDVKGLSKCKGIGKKTAERIIVELKDKIDAENVKESTIMKNTPITGDAVTGLMSLGFTKQEAELGISKAVAEGAESLEQIISLAIKRMV